MKSLNIEQAKEMLLYVAEAIIGSKPMLTEIDSKIGDGDHGIGMELGMQKAVEALNKLADPKSVNDVFKAVGRAMMMNMGGASGVIFGTLFQGGAKTAPVSDTLDCRELTAIFRGSLDAIKARGGAAVGDKTMVDALEPAVTAMENTHTDNIAELLRAAERSAAQGVEDTKKYEAKFGRAKSLMTRSIGYQDAGATSMWIIFKAMREYASNER